MFYLKVTTSITCEHDILVEFHKQVEPYQRSKLVESFIIDYLAEKKSGSEGSIPQSPKSKHQSIKSGVSNE